MVDLALGRVSLGVLPGSDNLRVIDHVIVRNTTRREALDEDEVPAQARLNRPLPCAWLQLEQRIREFRPEDTDSGRSWISKNAKVAERESVGLFVIVN